VSKGEYLAYFSGAKLATAIWLRNVEALDRPVTLRQLRNRWPWFRPPQSYCYVHATFERPSRGVRSLAPRRAK
jgi:predicted transcriptional regulator